jgi:viroplasmin and RNaseH domain-containing protein
MPRWPRTAATDYFKKSLELTKLEAQSPETESDEETRMKWMLLTHDVTMHAEARRSQEQTILKLEKQKMDQDVAERIRKTGLPL